MIRDRIIFRFGVPKFLISDDEKAFLSALLRGLESILGIHHISSTAYNSKAIAALERAHHFINETMRMLPVAQRPVWDTMGPQLEFAFNTVTCDTTGFTPFELCYGDSARTVTSVIAVPDIRVWEPDEKKTVGAYGRIRENARLFQDIARRATALARDDQNARLNAPAKPPVEFKVGQKVSVYMPNRQLADDWRPKHTVQWHGPMTVTQCEAPSIYEVKEDSGGRLFRRHISNMRAWTTSSADGLDLP